MISTINPPHPVLNIAPFAERKGREQAKRRERGMPGADGRTVAASLRPALPFLRQQKGDAEPKRPTKERRGFIHSHNHVIPAQAGRQREDERGQWAALFAKRKGARASEAMRAGDAREEARAITAHHSNHSSNYPGVSPIHTSPPSKYSFFQIGTTSFNRSMKYSADSNAGRRCAALTANTMLV